MLNSVVTCYRVSGNVPKLPSSQRSLRTNGRQSSNMVCKSCTQMSTGARMTGSCPLEPQALDQLDSLQLREWGHEALTPDIGLDWWATRLAGRRLGGRGGSPELRSVGLSALGHWERGGGTSAGWVSSQSPQGTWGQASASAAMAMVTWESRLHSFLFPWIRRS